MRKPFALLVVMLAALAGPPLVAGPGRAEGDVPPPPPNETQVRELYVPFSDLNVMLEGDPNRVLLSREEYDALLAKAKREDEARPPHAALVARADYAAKVGDERAEIAGTLQLSILEDGLHAVGLDMGGVGLRAAVLDGKSAPIGLADDGRLTVFVQGKGAHALVLDMVAPLQTTAARQILNYRLPAAAAATMSLTIPGDVEVKSGAAVVSRVYDDRAQETRIELLPAKGDTSLVMTLNSRLLRKDRVVVARSVLVDEFTSGYERLHATVSLAVLHRAVDSFRFAVPDGFEVTDVRSPNLARWAMAVEGDRRVLEVQLRDETTETVVLNLSAVRTSPPLDGWTLPRLDPLDVAAQVAVVGLAVEDRLKAEAITARGLVRINTAVLAQALPATVLEAGPGAARIRPVVAYYAPTGDFSLSARFVRPPAALNVVTNVLVTLEDSGLTARGGFVLSPEEDKRFDLDFSVPAGWDVTQVTAEGGAALPFERYAAEGGAGRIHVRLPQGVAPGAARQVYFTAVHVPKAWFGDWEKAAVALPVFAVAGAARDEGAVAVDPRDDMTVRPEALEGLTPLDENEKTRYGLEGVSAALAYRYDRPPYSAQLAVERIPPRATAQTFSFFRVERDLLAAHYEIVFDVAQARTRRLALVLPEGTPTALAIRGLDGVAIKEYAAEMVGEEGKQKRRWTALLAEPRRGRVRLAVDFEQRLTELEPADLVLPLVVADGVVYQSGLVAVEGSAELDVRVTEHPRRVDIGELVDADYQPGRRLLGAYGFVGDPPPVRVAVAQHPGYGLPPAIVQRAELATAMSATGVAQTAARFLLKTKALVVEVKLPDGSTLWSATLDGQPVKPQQEGGRLLLNLPAAGEGAVRDLAVLYETPLTGLGFWRGLTVPAPRLFLHASASAPGDEVPVTDLLWRLYLPPGFEVVRSEGTVVTQEVVSPPLALATLAGGLYWGTGGVDFDHGAIGLMLTPLRSAMSPSGRTVVAHRDGQWERARGSADGEEMDFFSEDGSSAGGAPADGIVELRRRGGRATADLEANKEMEAGARYNRRSESTLALAPAEQPLVEVARPAGAVAAFEPPPPPATPTPAKPAEPTSAVAKTPQQDQSRPAEDAKRKAWALEGISSLRIALMPTGDPVTFRSLGSEPKMDLTVVDTQRTDLLALGLALAVLVVGVALTGRSAGRKAAYVILVALVATLVPVVTARIELALLLNGAFYAACLLIPYYLAAACACWFVRKMRGACGCRKAAAAAALVVMAACMAATGAAGADEGAPAPYVVQIVPPAPPVKVPADAILLPYDPASPVPATQADRLLIPYDKYVDLWNRANPDQPLTEKPPPAPYALAGAAFTATLAGEEYLEIVGRIDLDVYTDEYATIPLPLAGGVLARADLDGKPARLSVAEAAPGPVPQQAKTAKAAPQSFLVLFASGKGRHQLDVTVRLRLERRGGWRVTQGRLPAAPATSLAITVPDAGTEVRLADVPDRAAYETKAAGETIRTALGPAGAVSIQWRPKVSEGQQDQTLTAASIAVLDVQEDSLRLAWTVNLEFRHGERDIFTVRVPEGYLVEKVEGTNVRGWQLKPADGGQDLDVTLLKAAKGAEQFTITLWRPTEKGEAPFGGQPFNAPFVSVTGAMRHTGRLVLRRSPLLDLRTVETTGVTRADLPAEPANRAAGAAAADESPLGIRPYQAYQFASTPFVVRLEAQPVEARTVATVQMLLKVAERERSLEARLTLDRERRPLYRVRFAVPADLKLDRVLAPGKFEWSVVEEAGRRVVTVVLAEGVAGQASVVVHGKLGEAKQGLEIDLPRIEVLDVDRQQGDIVVQADPAFTVLPRALQGLERILLERVFGWLTPAQKALAQVALHYTQTDYSGRLALEARKPDVSCFTVTNSRVTDRDVQDAILLNWTITGAGVREVAFLVPAWMKDARISVPLLRQKTVAPADGLPGYVRVRLQLQDEVMDELRVLVEDARLLTADAHDAPLPIVETGRTDRRYVAVESAGRDEVVIAAADGLEPLSRQQEEWQAVAGLLRGGMTQAFIVKAGADAPRLAFRTQERATVETAGARIGLAETVLVIDSSGAYRARQTYRVDNRTEQFLEVRLPAGAALWTAVVAGEPVKPTEVEGQADLVRIPIVKTAAGDLDYAVVLKYAGRLKSLAGAEWLVDFPLLRTVNINVELSQVTLHLPETYTWLDFRGTMGRVTDEGDFAAGELAYLNKMAGRLVQTLRSDNPYAQSRAMSNLKVIRGKLAPLQQTMDDYAYNEAVQTELSNTAMVLRSAEAEEAQVQQKQGQAAARDNNAMLRESFEGQRNRRARNMVNDLGLNWDTGGVQVDEAKKDAAGFNDQWLLSNSLRAADKPAAQPGGPQGRRWSDADQREPQQPADRQQLQQQAEVFRNLGGQAQAGKEAKQQMEQAGQQAGETLGDKVTRYQQRLEKHAEQAQTAAPAQERDRSVVRGFSASGVVTGGMFGYDGVAAEGAALADAPQGLASLDIELPERGVVYRFSTPRGEVQVTARAASNRLIEALERVAGVLVVLAAVAVLRRWLRSRTFSLHAQAAVSTLMIVAGVLGLLVGVFPLAALVAVIVGVAMKVALFFARRRFRAAQA